MKERSAKRRATARRQRESTSRARSAGTAHVKRRRLSTVTELRARDLRGLLDEL